MRQRAENGTFLRVPTADRFWGLVDRRGPNECWEWQGPMRGNGYGYTTDFWKKTLAHRFAYEMIRGPIPAGMNICHSCDNRRCVNPNHLFVGTHRDNSQDMITKGRGRFPGPTNPVRGEACTTSVLTEAKVREIRAAYEPGPAGWPHGETRKSIRALAEEYGVSPTLIHAVIKRKAWAHID